VQKGGTMQTGDEYIKGVEPKVEIATGMYNRRTILTLQARVLQLESQVEKMQKQLNSLSRWKMDVIGKVDDGK
jgi:uncharacterized protein YlxW (UPF0749 family)